MYLSTIEMIAIMFASTIMMAIIGILLLANTVLIKQDRETRRRFREYRHNCQTNHAEVPF